MQVLDTLPEWEQYTPGKFPGEIPAWSGEQPPPAIGERVYVRMNQCGPGRVTAYAVHDGFLGVMVKLDDLTRPEWHKEKDPHNESALVFGAELGKAWFAVTGRLHGDEEDTTIIYHCGSANQARSAFIEGIRLAEGRPDHEFDEPHAQVYINSVVQSASRIYEA